MPVNFMFNYLWPKMSKLQWRRTKKWRTHEDLICTTRALLSISQEPSREPQNRRLTSYQALHLWNVWSGVSWVSWMVDLFQWRNQSQCLFFHSFSSYFPSVSGSILSVRQKTTGLELTQENRSRSTVCTIFQFTSFWMNLSAHLFLNQMAQIKRTQFLKGLI